MKLSWIEISEEDKNEWKDICQPNHYKIISPGELPQSIPDKLRAKCNSAVILYSGEVGGDFLYCMTNMNRFDERDNAIDQEPFGFVMFRGEVQSRGCIIHHGNWENRTIYLSGEALGEIKESIDYFEQKKPNDMDK